MRYCINCLKQIEDETVACPYCGAKESDHIENMRALPPYTILNGKYIVGKVLGEGGFGITYMGLDLNLEIRVAIKEYYPSELATRDTTSNTKTDLSVISGGNEEAFKKGLDRFIKEAENLAKFNSLPGIVSVKDFFYENNTAYMVMEYIDGITLSQYLKEHGNKLPYTQVLDMMKPVMESLQTVHEAGIIHRDISPDNIMITKEGEMKLIDFGAARFVGNNDAKSLTVILKHGYAPPEQYQTDGKQGPWTDVYALSATMYRMITGVVPQEATDRMVAQDKLEPLASYVNNLPTNVSDAVFHGMNVKIEKRASSIKEFEDALEGKKIRININSVIVGAFVSVVLMCIIIGGVIYYFKRHNNEDTENNEQTSSVKDIVYEKKDSDQIFEKEAQYGENETDGDSLSHMIYNCYKEYFYDNYDVSRNDDYYIYFVDIEHKDIDNMIVVSPDVGNNKIVKIEIFDYKNHKVNKIYEKEIGSKWNAENYGWEDEEYTDMTIVQFNGEYYLCGKMRERVEDNTNEDGFYTRFKRYKLFYIVENCEREESEVLLKEKEISKTENSYDIDDIVYSIETIDNVGNILFQDEIVYSVPEWNDKAYETWAYDDVDYEMLMPEYIKDSISLFACNMRMQYGQYVTGIDTAYGHSYRKVFAEDNISEIYYSFKEISDLREKCSSKIVQIVNEDFDSNGDIETAYFTIKQTGKDRTICQLIIEDNGESILVNEWKDAPYFSNGAGFTVVMFGKTKGIMVGRPGVLQAGGHIMNLFVYDDESCDYVGLINGIYSQYDSYWTLNADRKGRVYLNAYGEGTGIDREADNKFYLSYIDHNYVEYDSIILDEEDINKIENINECITEFEYKLLVEWHEDMAFELMGCEKYEANIVNFLYSSNDMIYINYDVIPDDKELLDWSLCVTACFNLIDGSLIYEGVEYGRRECESGIDLDIRSYKADFPY